jgi:hypothetical protein
MNANEYAEGYRRTANIFEGPNRIDISLILRHQNEQRVCSNLLTVSEISLKNRSDESGHALKYNDVSFENNDETLCVKICSSKTDQKRKEKSGR